MKKHIVLALGCMLLFSCYKDAQNPKSLDEKVVSIDNVVFARTPVKFISPAEKEKLLKQVSQDSLFIDYFKAVIESQRYYDEILEKSPNFKPNWKKGERIPKNKAEFISKFKAAGFSNPEGFLARINISRLKLRKFNKRFPLFSLCLTQEEKKTFYKEITSNLMPQKNEK